MMDKKRYKLIAIAALALTTLLAIYGLFRASNLKGQLNVAEAKASEMVTKLSAQKELRQLDSLLAIGAYEQVITASNSQLNNKDLEDISGVQLRMDIAQKMLHLKTAKNPLQDSIMAKDSLDSIQTVRFSGLSRELKQYDSLSFALEKAKVQLASVRRQLQKRSFGEYLTFTNKKGSQMHYVGEVKHKKANGFGIALLNTGSRYEGEWKDNQRHGYGSFYWADGEYYVGNYVNDLRNGEGTYNWPNGEKYVGEWKDDRRNGHGIFYGADGDIVTQGTWEEDKLVKQDK